MGMKEEIELDQPQLRAELQKAEGRMQEPERDSSDMHQGNRRK